jgi:hypothetical protein
MEEQKLGETQQIIDDRTTATGLVQIRTVRPQITPMSHDTISL